MHHPTDRIAHTTASVTPIMEHWLEREIAQWVQPMKDRSDDPSHHERTLLPQSYISLHKTIDASNKLLSSFKFEAHSSLLVSHRELGVRCNSVVRAFAHGAMGRLIDPSWGEPIELFLVPASAP